MSDIRASIDATTSTELTEDVAAMASDVGLGDGSAEEIVSIVTDRQNADRQVSVAHVQGEETDRVRVVVEGAAEDTVLTLTPFNKAQFVETVTGTFRDNVPTVTADWTPTREEKGLPCTYDIAAATRPHPESKDNGDGVFIHRNSQSVLCCVIDGLGHGTRAKEARVAAVEAVESMVDRPIEPIFNGTNEACTGTRGVVMALLRIDLEDDTVTYGSVGNVEARTDDDAFPSFVPKRGVIDGHMPAPIVSNGSFPDGGSLVMYSDGIESQWELPAEGEDSQTLVRRVLDAGGASEDDATILAVINHD